MTFVYAWAAVVTLLSIYLERLASKRRVQLLRAHAKVASEIAAKEQQEFWCDVYRSRCRDMVCPVCNTKLEVK